MLSTNAGIGVILVLLAAVVITSRYSSEFNTSYVSRIRSVVIEYPIEIWGFCPLFPCFVVTSTPPLAALYSYVGWAEASLSISILSIALGSIDASGFSREVNWPSYPAPYSGFVSIGTPSITYKGWL